MRKQLLEELFEWGVATLDIIYDDESPSDTSSDEVHDDLMPNSNLAGPSVDRGKALTLILLMVTPSNLAPLILITYPPQVLHNGNFNHPRGLGRRRAQPKRRRLVSYFSIFLPRLLTQFVQQERQNTKEISLSYIFSRSFLHLTFNIKQEAN
jgi:hypothetical protein